MTQQYEIEILITIDFLCFPVCLFVYLFVFYGISAFVGYLIPNPFLYK